MDKKKRYTSEEKTMILREHFEQHISISDVADKYGVHPNAIYKWKKQMYESTPQSLTKNHKKSDKSLIKSERRIAELEALLTQRETLIAELVDDNIRLKKKTSGEVYVRNGLSRR